MNGSPLGSHTPLPARDPVFLHLTFYCIQPVFILLTILSRFGEPADVLAPSYLTIIFEGIRLLVLMSDICGCHCNSGWGGVGVDGR